MGDTKAIYSTEEEKEIQQTELRLKNVVEMGKFSYELKEKREQSLITQSGQMLTTFSIASAAVLMALPVMLEYTYYSQKALLSAAALILLPLVASMVLAVWAQWRFKYTTMENAAELLSKIEKNADKHIYQAQYNYQWIDQLRIIQESKKELNDRRVKIIKASQICFFIAIGILAFSAVGFFIFG